MNVLSSLLLVSDLESSVKQLKTARKKWIQAESVSKLKPNLNCMAVLRFT